MFWIFVSYESPAEHPTITDEERRYIEDSIGESAQLMGAMEVSSPSAPPPSLSHQPCAIYIQLILWLFVFFSPL